MKILAYCYGPLSIDKDTYCESFVKENKNYSLVNCSDIREQISGTKFIKDKKTELQVRDEISNQCLKILNLKNKNVIVNGLFLNEESRINLIRSIQDPFKENIKKVAIGFLPASPTSTYEDLKNSKKFKDLEFDYLRKQFLNFKLAEKQEEGDVLIDKIDNYSDKFYLETKLWGGDERISCDNFKKIAEYIKYTNSFN
jgi:hypothetical protein